MSYYEMHRLLKSGYPIIGSGAIGTAPPADSVANGVLWVDGADVYLAGKKTCKFIDQSSIPHYYCDSVNGSNSNDGLTELTPKQTVSAVKALAVSSCVLEFARGSYFREELSGLPNNCVVKAYGTGERPIFDCANVVTTFTKTGGYANIYQKTFTNQLTASGKTKISMWFDGVRMIRVTSQANCDATQGSFYVAISYTGTDTIYFHSPTSADPNTDGKVYELSIRNYGVQMSTGSECYSIATRRNGHDDGSLIGTKYISDCYAYDGTVHNIWNGGIAEDCIAEYCEPITTGSSTLFISYVANGTSSDTFRYTRCKAIGVETALYGWKTWDYPAFYAHTTAGRLEHILYENCDASNVGTFEGGDAKTIVFDNCRSMNNHFGWFPIAKKAYFFGCKNLYKNELGNSTRLMTRSYELLNADYVEIKGCGIVQTAYSGGAIYRVKNNSTIMIDQCTFASQNAGTFVDTTTATGSILSVDRSIIERASGECSFVKNTGTMAFSGDDNLFATANSANGSISNVGYANLTALRTLTSSNGDSVVGRALFAGDTTQGDFSISELSPASALQAGSTFYSPSTEDLSRSSVWSKIN